MEDEILESEGTVQRLCEGGKWEQLATLLFPNQDDFVTSVAASLLFQLAEDDNTEQVMLPLAQILLHQVHLGASLENQLFDDSRPNEFRAKEKLAILALHLEKHSSSPSSAAVTRLLQLSILGHGEEPSVAYIQPSVKDVSDAIQNILSQNDEQGMYMQLRQWFINNFETQVIAHEMNMAPSQLIVQGGREIIELKKEDSQMIQGAEVAASYISGAARWVDKSLMSSVPAMTSSIGVVGAFAKEHVEPMEKPMIMNRSDEVVTLTYSDAAKRATGGMRQTAQTAAVGIRDASTRGVHKLATKFEQEHLGEQLIPDKDWRDAVIATGTVGLATIGAVAVVAESLYETTKAVAQKTVSVTADVVGHKYGESAGKLVNDTGESAGNIVRTIKLVSMLSSGKTFTKSVAKNTGKTNVLQEKDDVNPKIDDQ
uniref:Senescence domain-containing protein n=1 Tax=Attheya septentrionalis TaxID=420275 RepID=A0A7S2UDS9_9STRA|mmetsp:Transcript_19037/g.34532  ORF Transcript_19037/g.34532 Transcript_19037/m.34532 type:complete len:427 (+) Transcript_19037:202-1482(+)